MGGEVVDRRPRPLQLRPSDGAAGHGGRTVARRNDRFQRIAAQAEVGGRIGHLAVGIDARRAVQFAPIEIEGDGVEVQDAGLEFGPQIDAADVQFVALHLGGAIPQRAVHGAQAVRTQRRVRQQLARSARGHDGVAGGGHPGRAAQNGGQVVDVEQAGLQIGLDAPTIPGLVDPDVARQVGRADAAAEVIEGKNGVVAGQLAAQPIRRRVGGSDTGQQIEVGEVPASQAEARVELSQVEWPGDRAVGHKGRAYAGKLGLEPVRPVSLDVDKGSAAYLERQGCVVDGAAPRQMEPGISVGSFAGVDRGFQTDVAALLFQRQATVADDQPVDRRKFQRSGGRLVRIQFPAFSTVPRRDQHHLRPGDLDQGHLQTSRQQRGQTHRRHGVVKHQRIPVTGPVGAPDADVADVGGGRPAEQRHVQVALEDDLALVFCRSPVADRAAQPVPLEQHQEDNDQGDDTEGDARGNLFGSAGSSEAGVDRIMRPDPRVAVACPDSRRDQGTVAHPEPVRMIFQRVGQAGNSDEPPTTHDRAESPMRSRRGRPSNFVLQIVA